MFYETQVERERQKDHFTKKWVLLPFIIQNDISRFLGMCFTTMTNTYIKKDVVL